MISPDVNIIKCQTAFLEAEAFLVSALHISSNMYQRNDKPPFYGKCLQNVYAINLSFSAELYLKCIDLITRNDFSWGHKLLDEVFKDMNQDVKEKIIRTYNAEFKKEDIVVSENWIINSKDFIKLLKDFGDPLKDLRYIFDQEFQFLQKIATTNCQVYVSVAER